MFSCVMSEKLVSEGSGSSSCLVDFLTGFEDQGKQVISRHLYLGGSVPESFIFISVLRCLAWRAKT